MVIKKNRSDRSNFVFDKYGTTEVLMTTPVKGAHQHTLLTIRDGKNRMQLTGHQVRLLRKVIAASNDLSA